MGWNHKAQGSQKLPGGTGDLQFRPSRLAGGGRGQSTEVKGRAKGAGESGERVRFEGKVEFQGWSRLSRSLQ